MNKYRPQQRNIDLPPLDFELDESTTHSSVTSMEIDKLETIADRIERVYMTRAVAVSSRIRNDSLRIRRLASGLFSYTSTRITSLEPGIEATQLPKDSDLVCLNYNDFFKPPDQTPTLSPEHTLWIAQSLLDYDFGLQRPSNQE